MEKLKDIKIKHNHTLTDILKVLIFALVMLAPFGAVLSKCLYTTFNKNAKDSYSGNYEITYKYQSNQVNSLDDLIEGNIYELSLYDNSVDDWLRQDEIIAFELLTELKVDSNSILVDETISPSSFGKNLIIELTYLDESYINVYFNYEDYTNGDYISFTYNATFLNNCIVKYIDNTSLRYELFHYTDYNEIESFNLTGTLDNSFYYAVNELSEQPLFSWTKNTFIYSTINQMTTGLDFGNNNVLALLLTYWILNTMIYIIFDIIIEVFKKLTHAFN